MSSVWLSSDCVTCRRLARSEEVLSSVALTWVTKTSCDNRRSQESNLHSLARCFRDYLLHQAHQQLHSVAQAMLSNCLVPVSVV